jgi:hypothetical protein
VFVTPQFVGCFLEMCTVQVRVKVSGEAVFRIRKFLDLPYPDPFVRGTDPDPDPNPLIISKKSKKTP